uniref:DUF3343 domain-containing protein n=1 Tax=Steinernema glaseri TaxID=37863 RepID=A0A1I7YYQ0_9BILA
MAGINEDRKARSAIYLRGCPWSLAVAKRGLFRQWAKEMGLSLRRTSDEVCFSGPMCPVGVISGSVTLERHCLRGIEAMLCSYFGLVKVLWATLSFRCCGCTWRFVFSSSKQTDSELPNTDVVKRSGRVPTLL